MANGFGGYGGFHGGENATAPPNIDGEHQRRQDLRLSMRSSRYLRRGSVSDAIRYGPAQKSVCSYLIIDPEDNNILRIWDCFTGLLLFYVCFATPVEVAFMDVETDALFVVNLCIDCMFFVDMILQFFLPYQQSTKSGSLLIYSHPRIIRNYLKTWFIVDFLSIFPFDLLALYFGGREEDSSGGHVQRLKILQTIRLFRLVKLVRLLKGLRLFQRYQTHVALSYRKTTLLQLFLTLVIAGHWLGCVLGLLMRMQGDSCVFSEPEGCIDTWATKALEQSVSGMNGEVNMLDYYLVSVHTSFTILVHPHKQAPRSREEFLMFTLCILCGGFIWARLIGKSTVMFTSLDRHHIYYRQTMDDLNLIIAEKGMSPGLRHKLREFFMNTQDMSQREMWQDIVKRMSPQLQREVARETNKHLVLKIAFLSRLDWDMATEVCMQLSQLVFSREDTFGEAYTLYGVSLGTVQRREIFGGSDSRKGPTGGWTVILGKGGHWGEEHLLLTNPDLLSDNRARCVTFCEVMALSQEDFANIAEDYPDCHAMLRRYYVRCAVFYGFLMQADQLLSKRGLPTRFFVPHPKTFQVERRHHVLKTYGAASRGFVPAAEKSIKLHDPSSEGGSARSVHPGEFFNPFSQHNSLQSTDRHKDGTGSKNFSQCYSKQSNSSYVSTGLHRETSGGRLQRDTKDGFNREISSDRYKRPSVADPHREPSTLSPFRRHPQPDSHRDHHFENGHAGNGERMIPATSCEIPDVTKREFNEVSVLVKAHCGNLDRQLSLLRREARAQCDELTVGMSALIKMMTDSRGDRRLGGAQSGQQVASGDDDIAEPEDILADEHHGVGSAVARAPHSSDPIELLDQHRAEAPD